MNENKQALIVMDEGSRFRDMLATTQGDGTYRAQMLEMLDAQDVVSAAASCNIVRPHSAAVAAASVTVAEPHVKATELLLEPILEHD